MNKLKKTLSMVLALIMIISSVSVCGITAFADDTASTQTNEIIYWDGTAVAPTKGEGTAANPYIIENAMHFSWALHESDAANAVENIYFSLNNDIYLNDISKINWSTGEVEEGYTVNSWSPAYFSGIIQGNGHTVYGMYINNNPTAYTANNKGKTGAGLLSDNYWNRAVTITNLGMDNVYIHHGEVAAVFIARQDCNNNAALTFDSCYIGENVTVKGSEVGGFVGYGGTCTVKVTNCYSHTSNLTSMLDGSSAKFGGILGDTWKSNSGTKTVENCYAVTKIYGNSKPNTYNNNIESATVETDFSALDFAHTYMETDGLPALRVFADEIVDGKMVWNGAKKRPANDEDNDGYWDITVPSELAWVATSYIDATAKFELVNDIYINDITNTNWYQATDLISWVDNTSGTYYAVLDGNGHSVYGLFYSGSNFCGIVPRMDAGIIQNISIKNSYINAAEAGGIVGAKTWSPTDVTSTIENCYSDNTVYINGTNTAGGIIGRSSAANLTINNCYSLANLTATRIGGIIANQWTSDVTVTNCFTNIALNGRESYDLIACTNCYEVNENNALEGVTAITAERMQGATACDNMSALDFEHTFVTTDTYPVFRYTISEDVNGKMIWNGAKVRPNADNDNDGYLDITKPSELAYAVMVYGSADTKFELTNDIYVNDISSDNWYETDGLVNWIDRYSGVDGGFYANLEGNGYIVYGIYYNGSGNSGLVPRFDAGSIKNIGLESSYISGHQVGGIFGMRNYQPTDSTALVENCYVDDSVIITGTNIDDSTGYTGGIGGYNSKSGLTIKNCYSIAQLSGNQCGGILADQWGAAATVTNCYTNTKLTGRAAQDFMTRTNCYEVNDGDVMSGVTAVTIENMQGKDVLVNVNKMTNLNADGVYVSTVGYPVLKIFKRDADTVNCVLTADNTVKFDIYSDTVLAELQIPARYGYAVEGFYADSALTNKVDDYDFASEYDTIYVKWNLIPIEQFANTYDEDGFEFTTSDGTEKYETKVTESSANYKITTSNIAAQFANGQFSQYDAFVDTDCGVDGSNAMKMTFAESYIYRWPTAFMIYDADGNAFVPETNSQYRITLKYKVNTLPAESTLSKNLNLVLRSVSDAGKADASAVIEAQTTDAYDLGDGIYQYGIFNDEPIRRGATTEDWVEEDLIFTTGDTTNALFIALVSTEANAYWAADIEILVDDITVQTMFIPDGLENGDVNGDGNINLKDLVSIKKMASGVNALTWGGDLDNDYAIAKASDITVIRQLLINTTPVVPETKGSRTLVWSDEFSGADLNYDNWGFASTMNNGGIHDSTKNHAYVQDGSMNLRVTKNDEDYVLPYGLTTRNKMCFKYGYLEVRAKLPYSQGAWPSIWMQAYTPYIAENRTYNPEIDILEVFSSTSTLKSNLIKHYVDDPTTEDVNEDVDVQYDKDKDKMYYTFENAENLSNEYHTYGFEWDENGMKFYVDDVLYNTISFEEDWWETLFGTGYFTDEVNFFKEVPFYININNEIFHSDYTSSETGSWAANYTISDSDPLPEYSIDWVRLYQGEGETLYTNYN